MKKIIFNSSLVLLLVGITSLVSAQNAKYSSSEANVSVTFPGTYETTEKVKEAYKSVMSQVIVDDILYYCSYTVHDNDLSGNEELAKISMNAFVEGMGADIEEEAEWKVGKNKGLQASLVVKDRELKGEYRVVIVGQIQYQITVVGAAASWDKKRAKKFLKSFKIKK